MLRCPNCKEKIARFPVKKQPEKTFIQNLEEGTIDWINMFKIDMMSLIWVAVLILLVISYKADTATCMEIIEYPLEYCEESNACKIIEERKHMNQYGLVDIDNIPEFNITI